MTRHSDKPSKRVYLSPQITTLSAAEVVEAVGPAVAILYGPPSEF